MSFFFGPAWTAQTGANSPNRYTSTLPPFSVLHLLHWPHLPRKRQAVICNVICKLQLQLQLQLQITELHYLICPQVKSLELLRGLLALPAHPFPSIFQIKSV